MAMSRGVASDMSRVIDSDTAQADEIRLAELAADKLKRQQQRIIENDAALVSAKARSSRKAKTEWKPLSLNNSSDENLSASDPITSRDLTPFDVHAKEFRPNTAAGSHSGTRSITPMSSTRSRIRAGAFISEGHDDEGGFQLVTGRKAKAASKPAAALNAYEARTSEQTPAIAAPFDKKEINEVFGNDLPPPEFVQSNTGFRNGQIQFVMHPNGDVSAQQWSFHKFQWTNIGQYSNIRRRREGMLAATRLKGETEQQALMQNTLAYFRAVAKQSEAVTMGIPWGPKEVNTYLPVVPTESSKVAQGEPPQKTPVMLTDTTSGVPTKVANQNRSHSSQAQLPPVPSLPQSSTQSSLDSMSFGGFPSAYHRNSGAWESVPDDYGTFDFANAAISFADASANGEHLAWRGSSSEHHTPVPGTAVSYSYQHVPGYESNYKAGGIADVSTQQPAYCVPPVVAQSSHEPSVPVTSASIRKNERSAMREYLNKLGESASARGTGAAAARTVLKDPLGTQTAARAQKPSSKSASSLYTSNSVGTASHSEQSFRAHGPLPVFPDDSVVDRRDLFGVSEPDPDPWNPRRFDVLDDVGTYSSLSNEELAKYSMPTPQNWKGPFFTGSPAVDISKKSYDEELRDWFLGGNTRARQDEFYERIKLAHKSTMPRKRSPGPIGPPNANATSSHKRKGSVDFNEDTTRLLIPVLENLASYVEGPIEKRHGPFARFAPAPEWCIDRGPNGNKSYFGDDWGQPPERIGRDARYRPMTFTSSSSRFGGHGTAGIGGIAVEHEPPMAIGTLTSLGNRGVQPQEGRLKFAGVGIGGRKW